MDNQWQTGRINLFIPIRIVSVKKAEAYSLSGDERYDSARALFLGDTIQHIKS